MEAFVRAHEMGADGIELDVSFSSDGYIIVLHDMSIDRTSDGSGRADRMTYRQLNSFDYSYGMEGFKDVHIPTLDEVLSWAAPLGLTVNVEIKPNVPLGAGMERQVVALAEKLRMKDRIIISSFNHYLLAETKRVDPQTRTGALYSCALVNPWAYAQSNNINALHAQHDTLMLPGVMAGCMAAGVPLHPWTVDDEVILTRLMEAGVANIITNRPDIALEVRRQVQGA